MHRDVRRVRDQAAVGPEERAREVEPLLNVRRDGRALQNSAATNKHTRPLELYEHLLANLSENEFMIMIFVFAPAHLLGDAHETVRENGEMNGIESS